MGERSLIEIFGDAMARRAETERRVIQDRYDYAKAKARQAEPDGPPPMRVATHPCPGCGEKIFIGADECPACDRRFR